MITTEQYEKLNIGDVISIGTNETHYQFESVTIKQKNINGILFEWQGNTQKVPEHLVLKYGHLSSDENEQPVEQPVEQTRKRGRKQKIEKSTQKTSE